MSYDFQIFITGVSPAQAIGLFNIEVEDGKDFYQVPVMDGNYVFYSGLTGQNRNDIILESTGMRLDTYASCTRYLGHVGEYVTTLIDNALHKTDSDFLVLSQFEKIIAMRRRGEVFVNAKAGQMGVIDFGIFDMSHQFRELPPF